MEQLVVKAHLRDVEVRIRGGHPSAARRVSRLVRRWLRLCAGTPCLPHNRRVHDLSWRSDNLDNLLTLASTSSSDTASVSLSSLSFASAMHRAARPRVSTADGSALLSEPPWAQTRTSGQRVDPWPDVDADGADTVLLEGLQRDADLRAAVGFSEERLQTAFLTCRALVAQVLPRLGSRVAVRSILRNL